VVDYKTDRGDDPELEARVARYHRQLDLYADALERLTGRPVAAKRLWFLRPRSTEP
jgi:ATP-dependent exoDNAse (exonuclease V) beta subunit